MYLFALDARLRWGVRCPADQLRCHLEPSSRNGPPRTMWQQATRRLGWPSVQVLFVDLSEHQTGKPTRSLGPVRPPRFGCWFVGRGRPGKRRQRASACWCSSSAAAVLETPTPTTLPVKAGAPPRTARSMWQTTGSRLGRQDRGARLQDRAEAEALVEPAWAAIALGADPDFRRSIGARADGARG
jgi:hypothetical protein